MDLQNPLTCHQDLQYDVVMTSLFSNESDHMAPLLSFHSSDFRLSIRRSVVSLLSHAKLSYDIDPFLVYLAVNYVDRFLSKHNIPEKKVWIEHILVVASLSLAAKMTNADLSTSLSHLQRQEGIEFDADSIHRMEKIILATLQWRMRSITPFSFLRYFISLIGIEDSALSQCIKHRASDVIFNVQRELKLLEYKPSIIAGSAVLCSISDSTALAFSSSKATICSCEHVSKDALMECLGVMQEITREPRVHATASGTLTPISVLDGKRTSSGSEEDDGSYRRFSERDTNVNVVKRRRSNSAVLAV